MRFIVELGREAFERLRKQAERERRRYQDEASLILDRVLQEPEQQRQAVAAQ